MKKFTKIIAIALTCLLSLATLFGCGGRKEDDGKLTLLVDMHGWMPTINTEPTLEVPKVLNAPRLIAEEFTKQTGIEIKWARSKPVGGLETEVGEWFATQIASDNCPAIAFSWGTKYQDRDYYYDLTEIMAQPNPYVQGNEKWSDMYEDYLFNRSDVVDVNGRIVTVPIALYPGPATGYYYNQEIFDELNLTVPSTFEEFVQTADKITDAGYTAVAPWGHFKKYGLDQWIVQSSIGIPIASTILEQVDTNGDGNTSTLEQMQATVNGLYNPVEHDYAKEVYYQAKRYFTEVLPEGWLSTDYMNAWDVGTIGMKEEGLWALYDEYNKASRGYDFGVFPITMLQNDTFSLVPGNESNKVAVPTFGKTEKGPHNPPLDLGLNIMKPAVQDNPKLLDAAVKFLQFMTQPDYITMMCEEQGAVLGAVKGSGYNSILDDYFDQPFPIIPNTSWPNAFTSDNNDKLNRSFGLWVLGSKSDSEFFADVASITVAGANKMAESMGVTLS